MPLHYTLLLRRAALAESFSTATGPTPWVMQAAAKRATAKRCDTFQGLQKVLSFIIHLLYMCWPHCFQRVLCSLALFPKILRFLDYNTFQYKCVAQVILSEGMTARFCKLLRLQAFCLTGRVYECLFEAFTGSVKVNID